MPPSTTLSAGGGSRPAGYGQSCTNCSRAKCKCILTAIGGACERCNRLGKDCQPIATARKKVAKRTAASRTAQLEEKLDDLVSILKSSQGHPGQEQHQQHLQEQIAQHRQHLGYTHMQHVPQQTRSQTAALDSLAQAATTERHNGGPVLSRGGKPIDPNMTSGQLHRDPTAEEADVYLAKFRTWLPGLPFLHLPSDMSAKALKMERPFLWLSIMNLASDSHSQQQFLREKVRREMSERIIMNHERNMDIVQGLIANLGWATLNTGPGARPFVVLFSQLATLVIYEQGMMRPPNQEHFSSVGFKAWNMSTLTPKARTMDERRAVLSLWFLTSMQVQSRTPHPYTPADLSRCNALTARTETLPWTSHMDESLSILERGDDQHLDAMLATVIKIQKVCDEAHRLLMQDLLPNAPAKDIPSYLYKPSLLERLNTIRANLPPRFATNYTIVTHLVATECQIHAIGLFSNQRIPDTQSVESMYQCLVCIRAFYDAFFSIPLGEIAGLPLHTYVALSTMQVMLYRLTISDNPTWDKEVVRQTVDVMDIVDRTIELFEKVASVYPMRDQQVQGNLFQKGAKQMRNLRLMWQPIVSKHSGTMPTPNSQQNSTSRAATEQPMLLDTMVDGEPIDFNDMSGHAHTDTNK
ncbi:hypothetical protein ISF_01860 [Cordyceps fumosorosea ARSEF 2679]|uniref:Zn(2)-C6 fungal-type domain-containing protein n=1 Tax=Cordyceps fumosorosea (strain ARSEF 2679) TaxID=1081104 RepID=A0A162MVR0_CORFA|nr:hypothetical protein ISF_01860 [Cordyceps fumosorosea ARSEF 2679]OAA71309.1 hypothetical protein ISF_01860 [Cordyceps fumosorosea ARSEF 2679]